jgi:S1-C subfamily serine protease
MSASSNTASLPDLVERLAGSVVGIATRRHYGSALLLRPGVAVGSASTVWRAPAVTVLMPGGTSVDGELAGKDGSTDLAAIRFDADRMPVAASFAARAPRVGDFVFAVARHPSGATQASFGRIGLVAGESRTWRGGRVEQLIRLDGGLYPGYEGAPVANEAAEVIGIASATLSRHHGVVLPMSTVNRVVDQLLAHGRVPRGYLGIAAQPVRITLEGQPVDGLLLSSVADDGPAARAGLQVSDVIVQVDGRDVASLEALRDALQVGARIPIVVARGGRRLTLDLDVGERPASRCH